MKTAFTFLLLGLLAATCPAAIVYSGLQNIPISSTFDSTFVDVDAATSGGGETAGWDIEAFFGGEAFGNSPAFQPVRESTANDSAILNLTPGITVGAGSTYAMSYAGSATHIGSDPDQFQSGIAGYLGFRITPDGGGDPWYGWMQVIFSNTGAQGTIVDWAYDNSGAPIAVAAVPEPSTAMLLAVLLSSFAATWRKRGR